MSKPTKNNHLAKVIGFEAIVGISSGTIGKSKSRSYILHVLHQGEKVPIDVTDIFWHNVKGRGITVLERNQIINKTRPKKVIVEFVETSGRPKISIPYLQPWLLRAKAAVKKLERSKYKSKIALAA